MPRFQCSGIPLPCPDLLQGVPPLPDPVRVVPFPVRAVIMSGSLIGTPSDYAPAFSDRLPVRDPAAVLRAVFLLLDPVPFFSLIFAAICSFVILSEHSKQTKYLCLLIS